MWYPTKWYGYKRKPAWIIKMLFTWEYMPQPFSVMFKLWRQKEAEIIEEALLSQKVSLCGPKPGYESAMQNPRNIYSKYLLGDDLKKAAKKAKWK